MPILLAAIALCRGRPVVSYLILLLPLAMLVAAHRNAAIVRAESERFPPARPISHVKRIPR